MNEVVRQRTERTKWYCHDRYGMFIHWGLYSIPARGEWVRSVERIPHEQYKKYMDEFQVEDYDPKEWAKIAKKAGMKYAVLTAKHHDGFCLFDTQYTDFKSTNTPCKRDLVREFVDAFREQGIKVGLYFSVIDWRHPDFPHYQDMHHPMRDNKDYSNESRSFDRYLDFMFHQVRELLTNYGKLDLMWFDFSYGEMKGEKWKASELIKLIRGLQPDIIIDNRLEGSGEDAGSIRTLSPSPYSGDFASPEQMIPPACICDEAGAPIPWEACITLNNNWGYAAHDHHYKSSKLVIRTLVECVSKGGNLILNVGPDSKGRIPKEAVNILKDVGEWMECNSDSIYGCTFSEFEKPEWGRFTQKGKHLYAHVMEEQVGAICLPHLAGKIQSMRLLRDGSEIKESSYWNLKEYKDNAFFFFDPHSANCYPLPDDRDTVVDILLK